MRLRRVRTFIVAHMAAFGALSCITASAPGAERSAVARADFMRAAPCPVTGLSRGPCPGYVMDHVIPLCAGGADHPSNMQWQTTQDAKIKDREERRMCSRKR